MYFTHVQFSTPFRKFLNRNVVDGSYDSVETDNNDFSIKIQFYVLFKNLILNSNQAKIGKKTLVCDSVETRTQNPRFSLPHYGYLFPQLSSAKTAKTLWSRLFHYHIRNIISNLGIFRIIVFLLWHTLFKNNIFINVE